MSRLFAVWMAFLSGAVLSACSPDKPQNSGQITLHIADQFNILRSVVDSAGEGAPKGYKLQWANFVGGPAIIAAETGGSIDVGWMRETPVVFAQAARSPICVVAVLRPIRKGVSTLGLVVAASSSIHGPADLKGKKIAYLPGTVSQYYLMRLLDQARLTLDDVKTVTVTTGAVVPLLEKGSIDAAVTADPFLSSLAESGKARLLKVEGEPLTPEFSFLVARASAVNDPKLESVLGDFVVRVARAYKWQREHVDAAVPVVAKLYKLPPGIAKAVIANTPLHGVPIDDDVIAAQQAEGDAFLSAGLIKQRIDASALFDNRFNARVVAFNRKTQ